MKRHLLKDPRKLLAKLCHVIAEFHYRNDGLDLSDQLVLSELFEPLMVVLLEVWIGIFLAQGIGDILVDCIIATSTR